MKNAAGGDDHDSALQRLMLTARMVQMVMTRTMLTLGLDDEDVVTVVVQTMVTMVVGMGQIVLRTVALEKNC